MTSVRPLFDCVTLRTPEDLKPFMDHYRGSTRLQQRRLRLRDRDQFSRFLYKYRGFSGQYAEQNLRATILYSVLRLSAPASFNDPFEMCVNIVVEGTRQQRQDHFSRLIAEHAPTEPPGRQAERMRDWMATPDATHAERCQTSLSNIRQKTGMFCFAGSPRNTLMWSHYADDHRGVCLQFERMKDLLTLGHAVRVDYRDDLPVANWIVGFQNGVNQLLLTKHPCWGYEQERRIISLDSANRFVQFRPDALTAIIFGCRAQKAEMELVDKLLAERRDLGLPAVKTYVASQHPTKYRLDIRQRV